MEMFRALVRAGYRPRRTVEFIAFAGEERGWFQGAIQGKAGSRAIAKRYKDLGYVVLSSHYSAPHFFLLAMTWLQC